MGDARGDGSCGARSRARFRGYGRAATRPRRGREVATRAVARGRGRRRGRARRARGRSTRDDATATRDDATATATRPRGDRPRARGFTRHQGRARVRKVVIFTTGRINWLNLLEWSIKRVVCGKRQQTSTSFLYSGALPATRRARRPVGIARRASRFRGYGREARKNGGRRARARDRAMANGRARCGTRDAFATRDARGRPSRARRASRRRRARRARRARARETGDDGRPITRDFRAATSRMGQGGAGGESRAHTYLRRTLSDHEGVELRESVAPCTSRTRIRVVRRLTGRTGRQFIPG